MGLCQHVDKRKGKEKEKKIHELRSNQKLLLNAPSGKMLPTPGGRAFSYAAPRLLNDLPSNITGLHSLSSLKRKS